MRAWLSGLIILLTINLTLAEDETKTSPADEAISSAINVLEGKLEKTEDTLSQAKIHRAISELKAIREAEQTVEQLNAVDFEVDPTVLKNKFQARTIYEPKVGILTLVYDFSKKDQLLDFTTDNSKAIVMKRSLIIDGSDHVTHRVKFKSFTVKGLWGLKTMRGGGILSTNGSHLGVGGLNQDTLYLGVPGASTISKIVPQKIRSGVIPFEFGVSPQKTAVTFGSERLTHPTVKKDDMHQIVLDGGTEGYAFSRLTISGVPEPKWFQEFLEAE